MKYKGKNWKRPNTLLTLYPGMKNKYGIY